MSVLDRQAADNHSSSFDKQAAKDRLFPVLDVLRQAELMDSDRVREDSEPEPEPEPDKTQAKSGDGSAPDAELPLLSSLLFTSSSVAGEEAVVEGPEMESPELQVPDGMIGRQMLQFLEAHHVALNFMLSEDIDLLWDPAVTAGGVAAAPAGSAQPQVSHSTHPTWLRCRSAMYCFDFVTKAHFLRAWLKRHKQALLQLGGESGSDIKVVVQRENVFRDAFCSVGLGLSAADLRNNFVVKFDGEEGDDLGGLTREWFELLSREIFNPDYALFSLGPDATYQPSSMSGINQDHLSYFRFVGRVIGLAIYHSELMGVHFTKSFYKHMLGLPLSVSDLDSVDPVFCRTLRSILETQSADMLCLSFVVPSASAQIFGGSSVLGVEEATVELVEGGADIDVDDENKHDYVVRVAHHRMTAEIAPQLRSFVAGLHEVVPLSVLRFFDSSELELLISGMPDIDVDDWRANTELHPGGFAADSAVVLWFWRALEAMGPEQRCRLLQFCTGSSRVPLAGFAALRGPHGNVMKFNLARDNGGATRLPTAHTCFNQLVLPEYRSFEQLAHRLGQAIDEGAEGFGFV